MVWASGSDKDGKIVKSAPAMLDFATEGPMPGARGRRADGDGDWDASCDLSVIIPLFNEEDNVEPLYRELADVLGGSSYDYELIFVDDGSKDGSLSRLRHATAGDPRVRIIQLRRNFGQTAALAAGIDASHGRVLVPMDADLQNDPHDIPAMLQKLDEDGGYDIVSGWRRDRKDHLVDRRIPSQAANWLIRYVTGVKLHDFGCTLKAYRREVLAGVSLSSELHRFLPALAKWQGARVTESIVNHRPRIHGKTKYGLRRTIKVLLDLVTVKFLGTYMNKPLYFFGKCALLTVAGAVVLLAISVAQKYGYMGQPQRLNLNDNVLVMLAALLAFLGVQCIMLGTISELLIRIYHTTLGDPLYRVRRVYSTKPAGLDEDAAPPPERPLTGDPAAGATERQPPLGSA